MRTFTVMIPLLITVVSAQGCEVAFRCDSGEATINNKSYPIACGRLTGRGMNGGEIGRLIRADGPWRRGLVAPGTPMITTSPQLCYDCFIHVGYSRFSNGCIGVPSAAFAVLKGCAGSKFTIDGRRN
jgi:hypothetical protein